MKMRVHLCTLFFAVLWQAFGSEGRHADPIARLVTTLDNLKESMEDEQAQDKKSYKATYNWCQGSFRRRKKRQSRYKEMHEQLASKLSVQKANARQLGDEIRQLEADISESKRALQMAGEMRGGETSAYSTEQRNSAGILTVLNKAVDSLSVSASRDALRGVALDVQKIASSGNGGSLRGLVSEEQQKTLDSFLQRQQNDQSDSDDGASQEESVDESATGGTQILQVLKDLISKFENEIAHSQNKETNSLEGYDSILNLKKEAMRKQITAKDVKDSSLAETLEDIAELERSITDGANLEDTGKSYIGKLKGLCSASSKNWAGRTKERAEIISGLDAVRGMLDSKGSAVDDADAVETTTTDKPVKKAAQDGPSENYFSFLQMETENLEMASPSEMGSAEKEEDEAPVSKQDDHDSTVKSKPVTGPVVALSQKRKKPSYSQVKRMVEMMVSQVQTAKVDDEQHKEWCEDELSKNKQTLAEKKQKMQRLATRIGFMQQSVTNLDNLSKLLTDESKETTGIYGALQVLAKQETALFAKSRHTHDIARQILKETVTILQRFGAVREEERAQSSVGFTQVSKKEGQQLEQSIERNIESVMELSKRYALLQEVAEKGATESKLLLSSFGKVSEALKKTAHESATFQESLKLQRQTALDSDNEEQGLLRNQITAAESYVGGLENTCQSILRDFEERTRRREENLRSLETARNIITINNHDAIKDELLGMENGLAKMAAGLTTESGDNEVQSNADEGEVALVQKSVKKKTKFMAKSNKISGESGNILTDLEALQSLDGDMQKTGNDDPTAGMIPTV